MAGITTALLGWTISQIIMYLLDWLAIVPFIGVISTLRQWPEVITIPTMTVSLAVGMVLNEIIISNPTRPRVSFKKSLIPLLLSILIGLLGGVAVGAVLQILYLPIFGVSEKIVRVLSWLCIGATVGIIESSAWKLHSMEAGDQKLLKKRRFMSLLGASCLSFIAAVIFEWIRNSINIIPQAFQEIEDPLGFCILGSFLGLIFTISTSPSYLVALRAGKGFEYRQEKEDPTIDMIDKTYVPKTPYELPTISKISVEDLQFVTNLNDSEFHIEEGFSIKLPAEGEIIIGGTKKEEKQKKDGTIAIIGSDVYLPNTPLYLAKINVSKRQTTLIPNRKKEAYQKISINGIHLNNSKPITLKHNTLIAFHTNKSDRDDPNEVELYRFVYYNRFLDPEG